MTDNVTPVLSVSQWFNSENDIKLSDLRGKVVLIEAFQMLCPGCVSHGLPQAQRVHDMFSGDKVAVIGLHTVFEHHAAMMPVSLQAFLHEYRITFPVGVDARGEGDIPKTMEAFEMRGTPTLILLDREGRRRAQYFGQVPDLSLGSDIATLLAGGEAGDASAQVTAARETGCDSQGCVVL